MSNRIYAQYRNSPKLIKWLDIVPSIASELTSVAESVRSSYDIDNATTYELDIIGKIVVQPRNFETQVEVEMLQLGQPKAQLGGSSSQLKNASAKISTDVSNEIYRTLIRAKIAKNTADGTIDSILKSVSFITGVESIVLVEGADMSFGLNFIETLTPLQRFMIQTFPIIPKPQGVRFLGFVEEKGLTKLGASQLQSASTNNRTTQLTEYFQC